MDVFFSLELSSTLWFWGFWGSLGPHLVGKYIIPGSPPISQGSPEGSNEKKSPSLHLQACHMPHARWWRAPPKKKTRKKRGGFPYGEWNNPNQPHTSVSKVLHMLYTHINPKIPLTTIYPTRYERNYMSNSKKKTLKTWCLQQMISWEPPQAMGLVG